MKAMMIRWLLPIVIDMAIGALTRLSMKSDNSIDDKLVGILVDNQDKLIDEIKTNL